VPLCLPLLLSVSSAFSFPLPHSPLLPAGASAAPGRFWRPPDPDLVHVVGDGHRASGFLHVAMVCLGPDRSAPPPLIALVAARPPSRPSLSPLPATGVEASRWWVQPRAFNIGPCGVWGSQADNTTHQELPWWPARPPSPPSRFKSYAMVWYNHFRLFRRRLLLPPTVDTTSPPVGLARGSSSLSPGTCLSGYGRGRIREEDAS